MINEGDALSDRARAVYQDEENVLFLSAVSIWEIALKISLGRLAFPAPPERYVPQKREHFGIDSLPLEEADVFALPKLPHIHKDPFDRMLVTQAIGRGLTILTPDPDIARYPVRAVW
jgi:PIN domain nuclease of toxin-antitoxin system